METTLKRLRAMNIPITGKQTETRSIRGTYDLSPEALEVNRDLILQVEEAQDKCLNCGGKCWQSGSSKGMIPILETFGDSVYRAVKICQYERQRRTQSKIDRLFKSARVPRAFVNDSFRNYQITPENSEAVKAAKWILANETGRGLFIYGPRGTGKTKLVAIIANNRLRRGKPVLFSSVPDLMGDIRATFHSGNTDEALKSVKEADFLVLDDLGAERMTDWVGEQLFAIINHRYNEKLTTIITSNYKLEDVAERMATVDKMGNVVDCMQGHRIMSRIYGMCERVYLGGRDYRTKGTTD